MPKFNSILVIDSDPVSNYMTKHFFTKIGLDENLHIRKNGKEALRFIDLNFLPELILLDLHTPDMDGFEFIEILKERGILQNTKLLIYSVNSQKIINETFGAIDKPLTYEKFCNATGMNE